MSNLIVSCRDGKVKGTVSEVKCKDAKAVYTFRNIPFAKPPVGSLRFMPPQHADPWTGIKDGSVVGNLPMQSMHMEEVMSKMFPFKTPNNDLLKLDEDCLHVSVYTTSPRKSEKLPVMVWFYGGGFEIGSETVYDGSALAGMNDVVVVVPNYRVGIFGFLSLGKSSICPGNAGMLDQKMALEWVRDNIGEFGGDPNNVTIFGESAGAVAVDLHVISPLTRGLFHRAISHSGQATMPGLTSTGEILKKKTATLLEHLKIDESEDERVLEVLQKLPAPDLIKRLEELVLKKILYYPVVNNYFLVKSPQQSLDDKDFATVPYIIGCNDSEGHGLLSMLTGGDLLKGLTEEQAGNSIFIPKNKQLIAAWKKFYIKDENDDKRFSKLCGNVISDGAFIHPAVTTASAHAEAGYDTFVYQATFQLRYSHDDEFGKNVMKKPDWCFCDHSDDINMTFGFPFTPGDLPLGARFSDEEVELSRKWMAYITNFAKNGDPNKGKKMEDTWPKYQPKGDHFIVDHKYRTGKNLGGEAVEFWSKTVQEIKKKFPVED